MELFKQLFSELAGFKSLREAVDKNISPVSVTGLSHIHRAQLIQALSGKKINLVITGSEAEAKKLCDDINMMGVPAAVYAGEGCIGCGACYYSCPEPGAITIVEITED